MVQPSLQNMKMQTAPSFISNTYVCVFVSILFCSGKWVHIVFYTEFEEIIHQLKDCIKCALFFLTYILEAIRKYNSPDLLWGMPQMKQSIYLNRSPWDWRLSDGLLQDWQVSIIFHRKVSSSLLCDMEACEGLSSILFLSMCLSFFNTSAIQPGLRAFKWSEFCNMAACPRAVKFGPICFSKWER